MKAPFAGPADRMLDVTVGSIMAPAEDVRIFNLLPQPGACLPPFEPGSSLTVHVSDGLSRQYSIASDPADLSKYIIAVKRESASRGGSAAMHALAPGDRLRVSGPVNGFPLSNRTAPCLLLGGGIGMTPLLAMAHDLARRERPFAMHYFTGAKDRLHVFDALLGGAWQSRVVRHSSDTGVPTAERLEHLRAEAAHGMELYVCGPEAFIARAQAIFLPIVGSGNVHFELFAPAEIRSDEASCRFMVELAKEGRSFPVEPGQTIVAALRAAGIGIATSCEMGICGTCLTRVLSGAIDHRDEFLSDEEKASGMWIIPCVSRCASSRLKLDI